jgi:hypothetical protein
MWRNTMELKIGFTGHMDTTLISPLAALALLLTGVIAQPAGAQEMDQAQFKIGCESGGGSYIENSDGSFQCNLRSGGTIKCQDAKSRCIQTDN